MNVLNRGMFKNRDSRNRLAQMGGILSSSPELQETAMTFSNGGGADLPDYIINVPGLTAEGEYLRISSATLEKLNNSVPEVMANARMVSPVDMVISEGFSSLVAYARPGDAVVGTRVNRLREQRATNLAAAPDLAPVPIPPDTAEISSPTASTQDNLASINGVDIETVRRIRDSDAKRSEAALLESLAPNNAQGQPGGILGAKYPEGRGSYSTSIAEALLNSDPFSGELSPSQTARNQETLRNTLRREEIAQQPMFEASKGKFFKDGTTSLSAEETARLRDLNIRLSDEDRAMAADFPQPRKPFPPYTEKALLPESNGTAVPTEPMFEVSEGKFFKDGTTSQSAEETARLRDLNRRLSDEDRAMAADFPQPRDPFPPYTELGPTLESGIAKAVPTEGPFVRPRTPLYSEESPEEKRRRELENGYSDAELAASKRPPTNDGYPISPVKIYSDAASKRPPTNDGYPISPVEIRQRLRQMRDGTTDADEIFKSPAEELQSVTETVEDNTGFVPVTLNPGTMSMSVFDFNPTTGELRPRGGNAELMLSGSSRAEANVQKMVLDQYTLDTKIKPIVVAEDKAAQAQKVFDAAGTGENLTVAADAAAELLTAEAAAEAVVTPSAADQVLSRTTPFKDVPYALDAVEEAQLIRRETEGVSKSEELSAEISESILNQQRKEQDLEGATLGLGFVPPVPDATASENVLAAIEAQPEPDSDADEIFKEGVSSSVTTEIKRAAVDAGMGNNFGGDGSIKSLTEDYTKLLKSLLGESDEDKAARKGELFMLMGAALMSGKSSNALTNIGGALQIGAKAAIQDRATRKKREDTIGLKGFEMAADRITKREATAATIASEKRAFKRDKLLLVERLKNAKDLAEFTSVLGNTYIKSGPYKSLLSEYKQARKTFDDSASNISNEDRDLGFANYFTNLMLESDYDPLDIQTFNLYQGRSSLPTASGGGGQSLDDIE